MTSPEAATEAVLQAEDRTKRATTVARSPLLVSRQDAAKMLAMGLSTFERYVQPELRLIRVGRSRLVPINELERWVERNAYRLLD